MLRWTPSGVHFPRRAAFLFAFFLSLAAVILVIAEFQSQLIFPVHAVGPPGRMPTGAELIQLTTPDRQTLHGVHVPPIKIRPSRTLILGFGGNAWNGADVAAYLHQLYPAADVVAFHYRGYRPSSGTPSSKALLDDAPLVHRFAVDRVKPARTVVVGFSIGSGVAAGLAKTPGIDGLILVTPFDSLRQAAADLYPWLPVAMFFNEEIDAGALLRGSRLPVAILAAERDTLILPGRTAALRRRVPNILFDRTISGAGHNDIYQRPEFHREMAAALDAILASPPSTSS